MDWKKFFTRLGEFPVGTHTLLPPCPAERIEVEHQRLGGLPLETVEMLAVFNGAGLFGDDLPIFTLFGLSFPADRVDDDWFIDRYTPKWRQVMGRSNDWVLGISNWGTIYVADGSSVIRGWDSRSRAWSGVPMSYEQWTEFMMSEGTASLDETA